MVQKGLKEVGYSYVNIDDGFFEMCIRDSGYSVISNKSTEQRRRWQKPGDITDVPRFVYGNKKGLLRYILIRIRIVYLQKIQQVHRRNCTEHLM